MTLQLILNAIDAELACLGCEPLASSTLRLIGAAADGERIEEFNEWLDDLQVRIGVSEESCADLYHYTLKE